MELVFDMHCYSARHHASYVAELYSLVFYTLNEITNWLSVTVSVRSLDDYNRTLHWDLLALIDNIQSSAHNASCIIINKFDSDGPPDLLNREPWQNATLVDIQQTQKGLLGQRGWERYAKQALVRQKLLTWNQQRDAAMRSKMETKRASLLISWSSLEGHPCVHKVTKRASNCTRRLAVTFAEVPKWKYGMQRLRWTTVICVCGHC